MVETTHGTEYLPDDVVAVPGAYSVGQTVSDGDLVLFRDYVEGTPESAECVYGFFGHYSAPGYMDCTPWDFDTDEDALVERLDDYYGDDTCPECGYDPCECDDESEG